MLDAGVKGWVAAAVTDYDGSVFLVRACQSPAKFLYRNYKRNSSGIRGLRATTCSSRVSVSLSLKELLHLLHPGLGSRVMLSRFLLVDRVQLE